MRQSILILIFSFSHLFSLAQDRPKFGAPLEIPLYLSGNFAELRRNHFHTGIDIKTAGVEGQKVVAAESGTVSRISVSPWGYGLALYLDHPNGYTTVYGHLKSFSPKIAEAVKAQQYDTKSFRIDFKPTETISVTKGELIAYSGNTGGSGGPHLHFEIRETASEKPQNPLLFGFDIKDNIPPRIRGVRFHPLSDTTLINGKHEAQSFVVNGADGKYYLKPGQNIEVYGAFGLSLHALDFLNGYPNKCGIYTLNLTVDGDMVLGQKFEELDFSTVRHINAYKDYEAFHSRSWHYHKSFKEPGNKLAIYNSGDTDGKIYLPEQGKHQVTYTTKDAYGNESVLNFEFTSLSSPKNPLPQPESYDAYFPYDQENSFGHMDEINVLIPKNALYQDLKFSFSRQMKNSGTLSPVYLIHREEVPLQEPIEIKFAWGEIPRNLHTKVVARRSTAEGRNNYLAGKATEEGFVVKSKDFGKFTLVADTSKPFIEASKWSQGGTVTDRSVLSFKIGDNLSGVENFNGYLNGEWVLVAYEPKSAALSLNVGDSNFAKGENLLEIEVVDAVGNSVKKSFRYSY